MKFNNSNKTIMKTTKIIATAIFSFALFAGTTSFAQDKMMDKKMNEKTVMVGGAAMYPTKNIV